MSPEEEAALAAAQAEFAAALKDAGGDHGQDEAEDAAADLLASVAVGWPAWVAWEVCRTEIGWVPGDLRDQRPDVAQLEDEEGGFDDEFYRPIVSVEPL